MAKKNESKIFGLSDRYLRKMNKDILLNVMITFVFYLMFNLMFKDNTYYGILKILFVPLFLGIAVVLVVQGRKRAAKAESIHYEVKKDGLEYFDGKKTMFYPWIHFKEVRINSNRFSQVFPYEYYTEEGMFILHRQLGKPEDLIPIILREAGPYAKIDPNIPDVLKRPTESDWLGTYMNKS